MPPDTKERSAAWRRIASRVRLIPLATEALCELGLAALLTRFPERWWFRLYRLEPVREQEGETRRDRPGSDDIDDRICPIRRSGRIGHVVQRVAEMPPLQMRCLLQALATHRMLKRRGLPSTVVFGVHTDRGPASAVDGASSDHSAHAWVEVGELVANGARHDLERYGVVGRYT